MPKECVGEIVREFYSGSTKIRFNDAYYRNRTKEEIDESWFRFSKVIYKIHRRELEKKKQNG